MTPQERELILGVAGRLQQAGPQQLDDQAADLIQQHIVAQPQAAYLLTQTVIVQNIGLEQAQQRIEALEQQLEQAQKAKPAAANGGFLGGTAAAGDAANPATAINPTSSAAASGGFGATGAAMADSASRSTVGSLAAKPATAAAGGNKANNQAGAGSNPARGRQAGAAGGGMGDFMRSAAAMAVGVAGGHLLFNGLSNMFGDDAAADPAAQTADASGAGDTGVDAGGAAGGEAAADSGGWGADQGVSDEALAGDDPSLWEQPSDAGGWSDANQADTVAPDDGGFADAGDDFDSGMDDDWG